MAITDDHRAVRSSGRPRTWRRGARRGNLNQAEDDLDRRRFLFANEAHNQIEAGRAVRARSERADARQVPQS